MKSLQAKVTVLATVVTALLIGLAGLLMLVSQRAEITTQTADSSRVHYMCSSTRCVPLQKNATAATPGVLVRYASTEVRPVLSLWPFSGSGETCSQQIGEGPHRTATTRTRGRSPLRHSNSSTARRCP